MNYNKKDLKLLYRIAKKTLNKDTIKKIKSIPLLEQSPALKYSLSSYFKNEFHDLKLKIKNLEDKNLDLFFIKNNIILFPSKIKHFESSFSESDFYKLINLTKIIKEELENVRI